MVYCTKCGKEINGKKFCEHCNTKKNNRIHNFCKWCGTPLEAGSKICTACGEKKRDGNFIIKFISAVFGSIIIFYGIVNINDSVPMAIVHILQGILFMPFMHNIFKKLTHKKIKLRKPIIAIGLPFMFVFFFISTSYTMKISNYKMALNYLEDDFVSAAMVYFDKSSGYKDADERLEKLEKEVISSLKESPWCSQLWSVAYNKNNRWDFVFSDDKTGFLRKQLWTNNVMRSYKDINFEYELVYDVDKDSPTIDACVHIYADNVNFDETYNLSLGLNEDGTIVVLGLYGRSSDSDKPSQSESWFARDSHLPELK